MWRLSSDAVIESRLQALSGNGLYVSLRGDGLARSDFVFNIYSDLFLSDGRDNPRNTTVRDLLPTGSRVFVTPRTNNDLLDGQTMRYRLNTHDDVFSVDSATGVITSRILMNNSAVSEYAVVVRQLKQKSWIVSHFGGCPSLAQFRRPCPAPHVRLVTCSTKWPCFPDADRCLQPK